jgi:hypothetical protein
VLSKGRGILREAPLAVLVAGVIAVGAVGCASASSTAGQSAAVTHAASRAAQAATPTAPRVIGGLVVGKAYAYRLYIHCGVGKIMYGGLTWGPVPPVTPPPGNRPVNGQTTYDGYVAGALTLEQAGVLRFTADTNIVVSPWAVTFKPAATPGIASACS